jgi:hypothetical protein
MKYQPPSRQRECPQIVLSVDTEPDNQWEDHRRTSAANIAGLPRFQEEMEEIGLVPTYLLTYSIATNAPAARVLREIQRRHQCEIGSHLHPWDNPPFLSDGSDHEFPAFAHDLPVNHVHEKLFRLTARIAETFGSPTSYRAGRFGFAPDHISVLESLGYAVDSSVTPLLDRRAKCGIPKTLGGRGGRDYRSAPLDPYHPDYRDDLRVGTASLVEVPLTTGLCSCRSRVLAPIYRRIPAWGRRITRRLHIANVVSASPIQFSSSQLIGMLETALRCGRRVFNFTLHSSETIVGASPSVQTEEHREEVLSRLRSAVGWLRSHAPIHPCGLSEVAKWYA